MENRLYRGFRQGRTAFVYVDSSMLSPEPSRYLHDHSVDFEWGYTGSGPSQLALAILYDCTDDAYIALGLYQAFKMEFIADAAPDGFVIMECQILDWIHRRLGTSGEGEDLPGI